MNRTFIEVPLFTRRWAEIGFDDDALRRLQQVLLMNPQAGTMMQGTGGIRKLRFALPGKGKSGGARVCYVDYMEFETIYLITAFTKDEQANLSQHEKEILKTLVKQLKAEAAGRWRR